MVNKALLTGASWDKVTLNETSNQLQTRLKDLMKERDTIYNRIRRDSTVRASIVEDEKKLIDQSQVDIDAEMQAIEKIDYNIMAIRHAKNMFNTTYVLNVDGDITIDMALVEIATLKERLTNISGMAIAKPKTRVGNRLVTGKDPEYDYTTYDIAKTKEFYDKIMERVHKIYEALNIANANVPISVEIYE